MQNYRGQNLEVDIEVTIEMKTLEEVEVGLEKDSIQVILEEMIKAVVDQDQVPEQVLMRDRIRCFKCREYDCFAKDCLNISDTEKEQSEQRYNKCLI